MSRFVQAAASHPEATRPPISGKEKILVALAVGALLFTGWGLGGMRLWTQWVLGGIGLVLFLVALAPWGNPPFRGNTTPWGRLFRFPVFWIGGLFLLYCLVQQWNPAWVYQREGSRWWLQAQDPILWLPAGIVAPLEYFSGWRTLIWMGGAFLAVCGLWVGLQSRRSARFLIWVWVLNSTAVAFVGMIFSILGSRKMLGLVSPGRAHEFFANFYYPNHAGAFLLAGLCMTLGLSLHAWVQAQQRGSRSNPGFFLVLLAVVQFAGIFFTGSRGSILLSLVAVGIFAIVGLVALGQHGSFGKFTLWSSGISVILLLAGSFLFFANVDFERIHREMQRAFNHISLSEEDQRRELDASLETRQLMARATLDMWEERPWTGHGLGGYRHYIVVHQKNYEPIYVHPLTYNQRRNPEGKTLTWRLTYAHSDWLHFLAEIGILGCALLVLTLVAWAALFFKKATGWTPATWVWLSTLALLVLYAAIEFILWSPSVFWAFCLVPLLTYKSLR